MRETAEAEDALVVVAVGTGVALRLPPTTPLLVLPLLFVHV